MEKGWNAAGLLAPLWRQHDGGRDGLAAAVGTTGTVLSSINTGKRPLGRDLGQRLATSLEVSLLELGAPEEAAADHRSVSLRNRQEELEAEVLRLTKQLARLARRVAALERQAPSESGRGRAAR